MFEVYHDEKYGAVLKVQGTEEADEFDDFLAGSCYVFYDQRPASDYVEFFFGQASSVEKVQRLVAAYRNTKSIP